ncbi:MAG: T9SS type A sorting domain-containing protein [Bacteroidota bacterium]
MMRTTTLRLICFAMWIHVATGQTTLKYYGVDDIDVSSYKFLKDSLRGNFALVEIPADSTLWKTALTEAEKYNIKLIIWPEGSGQRYTCWKYDVLKWDWDISEGLGALQYAERYITSGGTSLMAVLMSHEPYYSKTEMVFVSSQLAQLNADIKNVAPHIKTYVYMNDMAWYDSTDVSRQMSDAVMDICGTYKHSFGTKHTEEETLHEIDGDRALIERKGLHTQLFFAMQGFGYDTPDYRMPDAWEMRDLALKILDKHKLDGAFWYPWKRVSTGYTKWLNNNRYDSLGADRWQVITDLSSYLTPTGIHERVVQPTQLLLSQNYPNPFNPSTTITFVLPKSSFVSLKVFDVLGREIQTLVSDELPAGTQRAVFDASHLNSGVYFYRLTAGGFVQTGRMLLVQ